MTDKSKTNPADKTFQQKNRVQVEDSNGRRLNDTYADTALKLVYKGKADIVCDEPLTIRLRKAVIS